MRMHTKLSSRSGEAQDGGKRVARPIRANRCLAVISSIWNWAEKRDEVPAGSNPAMGVERNTEKSRERYLSSEELKRLGNALHRAETVGLPWNLDPAKPTSKHHRKGPKLTKVDLYAVAAIRLLVLTGARLREILTAKWEWIDWERGMIMLPDSKTGAKPIFLNSAAIDILKGLPRIAANPYIIPGMGERIKKGEPKKKPKPAPRADLKRPWDAVSRAAGLDGVRIHDLRHTHAATGAGAGLGLQMVGKLLGHSQPQTTQRYAHLDADPIKRASNIIGDKLAEAMNGPGRAH
jgi:integrase